jgi:hypothetical protein
VPLLPSGGGRAASAQSERQVCASEAVSVPFKLGPFKETACGAYEVTHLAQVRPLGSPAASAVTSVASLPVEVTGCPGGELGLPAVTLEAPKPALQEVHKWGVTASHNGSNPLVVQQKEPVKVNYAVETHRALGKRTLDLEGALQLEAPGDSELLLKSAAVSTARAAGCLGWALTASRLCAASSAVRKGPPLPSSSTHPACEPVDNAMLLLPIDHALSHRSQTTARPPKQVGVFDGRSSYTPAPLDCGAASKPGGAVALPPKGTPVTCTFKLTGQPVSAGVVVPMIVPDGAAAPVPAVSAAYTLAGAPIRIAGGCASLGSSLQLLKAGRAAPWQPGYTGRVLRSAPLCSSGGRRFSLWFGATPEGARLAPACGDYVFRASFTAVPDQAEEGAAVAESEFAVKVVGCKEH